MMGENYSKTQKIEKYKRDLIKNYFLLMSVILLIFTIIFNFFIYDKVMSWYLPSGLLLLVYSYIIVRKNYTINVLVHTYMLLGTLYVFYIILAFWNSSVASFVWLIPMPLGAYIFFRKIYVILYSILVIAFITGCYIISNNFHFDFQMHGKRSVNFTDTILIVSNVAVIFLLLYYKDKIRKEEIYYELVNKQKSDIIDVPNNERNDGNIINKEVNIPDELFQKIENSMKIKCLYRDVNFNISKLSTELGVNSGYISKSIRNQGYSNFNTYLNFYRVNHVKEMLAENDLKKITLMYIYTEAGFSNQSTFNRVFKQIEKITPSEYIQKMQGENF
jgi:AraC-like DNA-binding protein